MYRIIAITCPTHRFYKPHVTGYGHDHMNKYVIPKIIPSHDLCLSQETVDGFPETYHEVRHFGGQEGYHILDPEQDGLSVFCHMSTVTAVVHHNIEKWTYVSGYRDPGSYDGEVGSVFVYALLPVNHVG